MRQQAHVRGIENKHYMHTILLAEVESLSQLHKAIILQTLRF